MLDFLLNKFFFTSITQFLQSNKLVKNTDIKYNQLYMTFNLKQYIIFWDTPLSLIQFNNIQQKIFYNRESNSAAFCTIQ